MVEQMQALNHQLEETVRPLLKYYCLKYLHNTTLLKSMHETSADRLHNFSRTHTSTKLNLHYMVLRISDDIFIERGTVAPIACMLDVSGQKYGRYELCYHINKKK